MRLLLKKHSSSKINARLKKKIRIRKTLAGTAERPRLSVFRSAKHIYAQLVDDVTGSTVLAASTLTVKTDGQNGKDAAKAVGMAVAQAALAKDIKNIVFDRNGFVYHGRVKALADGAREAGLNF